MKTSGEPPFDSTRLDRLAAAYCNATPELRPSIVKEWLVALAKAPWLRNMASKHEARCGGRIKTEEFEQAALLELAKYGDTILRKHHDGTPYEGTAARNAMTRLALQNNRWYQLNPPHQGPPGDDARNGGEPPEPSPANNPFITDPEHGGGKYRGGPEPEELLRYNLGRLQESQEYEGRWCRVHRSGHPAHTQVYPAVWEWASRHNSSGSSLSEYVLVDRWQAPGGGYARARREAKGCIAWISYSAMSVPLPDALERGYGPLRTQLVLPLAEAVAVYMIVKRRHAYERNREVPVSQYQEICQTHELVRKAVNRRLAGGQEPIR